MRQLPYWLVIAALAGCTVGPDYQRPALSLPERHPADTADPAIELRAEWWKLFGDPALDGLIEHTLKHNADLKQAVARIEELEAVLRETGTASFPQVDLNGNIGNSRASQANSVPLPSGVPIIRHDRGLSLGTTFEVDFWGKMRRADEAARAQTLASRHARATTELTLIGMVAKTYFSLRALEAQFDLAQDTLETRQRSLAIAKARLDLGASSRAEFLQAEAALAAQRAVCSNLRQQRDQAQQQLALLSGRYTLELSPGQLKSLPVPPIPPAGLPSRMLETRPDVREAEEGLVAANARIGVVKAALFPTISLTAGIGSQSKELGDLFSGRAGTWTGGLQLNLPFFDAGRGQARVDQASARQRQALAVYEKAVQSAFRDINDALVAARESAIADEALQLQMQAAASNRSLADTRYQAGLTPPGEALEARRNFNEASAAWLRNRQARLSAVVDVFKALGGGWKG